MYKTSFRIAVLSIACSSCLIVFPQTSLAMDVSTLADICEAMEDAIADVSVEYEWELVPPMTKEDIAGTGHFITVGPIKHSLTTKRPFTEWLLVTEKATNMNEWGDCQEGTKKLSYNGDTIKLLQESISPSEGAEPRKSLSGSVSRDTRLLDADLISLTPLGFTVLRLSCSGSEKVPLSRRLRYKEGALARIDNSIQKINDCNSICVDLLQEYTKQVCRKVYFSVDHDYTPVRYEYMSGPDRLSVTFDITSLEKVGNGLWFPSSFQTKVPDPGEGVNRFHTTGEIRVNRGIADEVFDIVFPPGTRVVDEISGKQYTIKPTQEQVDQTLNGE